MTAETSIVILRPPDEVFAFLADPRNDPRWCNRVRSVEAVGEGEYRVMHKPLRIQPRPYELHVRLVASDPPRHIRWEERDRDGTLVVDYVLVPRAGGTRFTQRTDLSRLPAHIRLGARFTIPRHIAQQARTLKRVLEAGSPNRLLRDS
jgi:uncharacterized protein YndB with AHSA1/START domain